MSVEQSEDNREVVYKCIHDNHWISQSLILFKIKILMILKYINNNYN